MTTSSAVLTVSLVAYLIAGSAFARWIQDSSEYRSVPSSHRDLFKVLCVMMWLPLLVRAVVEFVRERRERRREQRREFEEIERHLEALRDWALDGCRGPLPEEPQAVTRLRWRTNTANPSKERDDD